MTPPKCAQCGATLDPLALACPYCRLTTPAGVAAERQAEQQRAHAAAWQAHAQSQHVAGAARQVESTATQAFFFSLGGLVCCVPLSIAAVVQGIRARGMAKRFGLPTPPRATWGLALGIAFGILSVGGLIAAGFQDSAEQDEANARIKALEATAAKSAAATTLDHATACALAEIYARKTGWAGEKGHRLDRFECSGRLDASADRARLEDFRFHKRVGEDPAFELSVCFKRGGSWYVSKLSQGACDDGP